MMLGNNQFQVLILNILSVLVFWASSIISDAFLEQVNSSA